MDLEYPQLTELSSSSSLNINHFYTDSGYSLETYSHDRCTVDDYNEKPPLTALTEVIQLIGQPTNNWINTNHQQQEEQQLIHQNEQQWIQSTVPQDLDPNAKNCQVQSNVFVCKNCLQIITEQFLLKIGNNYYHENCTKCVICLENLKDKCYEKNDQLYCMLHYYSEYSNIKCYGCGYGISPIDIVYKLKNEIIYHINCHICNICGKNLIPGEKILYNNYTKFISCSIHQNFDEFKYFNNKNDNNNIINNNEMLSNKKMIKNDKKLKEIKKEKIKTKNLTENILQNIGVIPQYPFEMYAFGEMCSDDNSYMKRRGPRTTIKQSQLDVLNQIFLSSPKPSKHTRAKIALETGLSMRVIQVWFQNRRSKERRLKHLCNFLRHYERNGLTPPSFNFNPEDGTFMGEPISPSILHKFNIDDNFNYEDDSNIKDNDDVSSIES